MQMNWTSCRWSISIRSARDQGRGFLDCRATTRGMDSRLTSRNFRSVTGFRVCLYNPDKTAKTEQQIRVLLACPRRTFAHCLTKLSLCRRDITIVLEALTARYCISSSPSSSRTFSSSTCACRIRMAWACSGSISIPFSHRRPVVLTSAGRHRDVVRRPCSRRARRVVLSIRPRSPWEISIQSRHAC